VDISLFHLAFIKAANLSGRAPGPIIEVREELQRRWAEVLAVSSSPRLRYTSGELRPRIEAAFDAPSPGWPAARYVSPDVMIAAPSVDAIRRGDYELVLGEVHLGNTLVGSTFVSQHPDPDALFAAFGRDVPEPAVVLVVPKGDTPQRQNLGLPSNPDLAKNVFFHEFSAQRSPYVSSQTLRAGDLVIDEGAAGLEVRTRDGRLRFDPIQFLSSFLSTRCASEFHLFAPADHRPRVTVDRVVIAREAWRFRPSELRFAHVEDPASRLLEVRRWARRHAIPRFTFLKVPLETKPCYVDLDSPTYVDIATKLVRSTEASDAEAFVVFTEMLPTADQCWLEDRAGNRYTSELRMVTVDGAAASWCERP